jgi:hypothetical protein
MSACGLLGVRNKQIIVIVHHSDFLNVDAELYVYSRSFNARNHSYMLSPPPTRPGGLGNVLGALTLCNTHAVETLEQNVQN